MIKGMLQTLSLVPLVIPASNIREIADSDSRLATQRIRSVAITLSRIRA